MAHLEKKKKKSSHLQFEVTVHSTADARRVYAPPPFISGSSGGF